LKITEETIPMIEKALGFKLFPWQKEYLVNDTPFPDICPCLMDVLDKQHIRDSCDARFDGKRCRYRNRGTGHTVAHCIDLALSDGQDRTILDRNGFIEAIIMGIDPIDTRKMEHYSDYGDGSIRYAMGFYRHMFLDIWHQLKAAGLPVRELRT
jgi:hypothetical protein